MPHPPTAGWLFGRTKIVALIAILLIIITACSDDPGPTIVSQQKDGQAVPRLDRPGTFTVVIAHEAEFNGNELAGRERRLIIANEILPDSRGYFVLSPRDEPAKQVTSFTGGYTESLIQDLETASEFCAISLSADRCLFISLNYRPCRVIENCDYHTVTEATMVIVRSEDGALFATLTEQLDRPADQKMMTEAVNTALREYIKRGGLTFETILSEITLGTLSDKAALVRQLNQALTDFEEKLDDSSYDGEARGYLLENIFEAIDELFVWPTVKGV